MDNQPIGRADLPRDETECLFDRWGWLLRGLRDAPRLMVSRFWAACVWIAAIAVVTAVFIVVPQASPFPRGPHPGNLLRVALVLLGITVGTLVAVAIVGLYGFTDRAHRTHWRSRHAPYLIGSWVPEFWLESRHWHKVINVECEISSPGGTKTLERVFWPRPDQSWYLGPGDRTSAVRIPHGAASGVFRFKWSTAVEGAAKPITIRS